jgi:hypothetical protein
MSRPFAKNRIYQRTGFASVGQALSSLHKLRGDAWIDSLGKTGEVLREWRAAIIGDLGGEDTISAMQRAVVDLATRTYLLLESVDRFLLEQPSLVNKSRRQVYPAVLQRQQLADALARYMGSSASSAARARSPRSRTISKRRARRPSSVRVPALSRREARLGGLPFSLTKQEVNRELVVVAGLPSPRRSSEGELPGARKGHPQG